MIWQVGDAHFNGNWSDFRKAESWKNSEINWETVVFSYCRLSALSAYFSISVVNWKYFAKAETIVLWIREISSLSPVCSDFYFYMQNSADLSHSNFLFCGFPLPLNFRAASKSVCFIILRSNCSSFCRDTNRFLSSKWRRLWQLWTAKEQIVLMWQINWSHFYSTRL